MAKKSTGWELFKTLADCKDAPETTMIADPDSFALNAMAALSPIDLHAVAGAGVNLEAVWLEFIFTHSAAADADGTTSVFELYTSVQNGPIQVVCSLALTGGKARYTASSDLVTWVDTIVATNYRGASSAANDSGVSHKVIVSAVNNDCIASASVPVLGSRYWLGLFTGAGSTAVTCNAYWRWYTVVH